MMSSDCGLVYISMNRWDSAHQRAHHLAENLSHHYRVLYVDPADYSVLGYARHRMVGDRSRNLRAIVRSVTQGLVVYTPPALLPFARRSELAKRTNYRVLTRLVAPLVRALGVRHVILCVTHPSHLVIVGALGESLLCYDCMDDYAAFQAKGGARATSIEREEQRLLARSDVVIASAQPLYERLRQHHTNVHLVRNAASEQFCRYRLEHGSQPPPDWPAGEGPVIGYAGMVSWWIDVELIAQIATRHPNWRVVLVGSLEGRADGLASLPNVHLLGARPYAALPDYVARFDVALIPFLLNRLTQSVNPVKVYEYLALGKAVVATRLPELVPFEEVCYLAGDRDEFVRQVERAVEELGTGISERMEPRRRSIATTNTWAERANRIAEILDERLGINRAA